MNMAEGMMGGNKSQGQGQGQGGYQEGGQQYGGALSCRRFFCRLFTAYRAPKGRVHV